MSFITLTHEQEQELSRLSRFYWREALKCEEAKAYLAGCTMLGSALETLLILMVNCYSDEAERTGVAPKTKGAIRPLLKWTLAELLRVAKASNWLPSGFSLSDKWSTRKAEVGDYAEVMRMIRNLIHPARYAADHYGRRVTAKYLQRQFDVALLCRDWLAERNAASLRQHMREEGLL